VGKQPAFGQSEPDILSWPDETEETGRAPQYPGRIAPVFPRVGYACAAGKYGVTQTGLHNMLRRIYRLLLHWNARESGHPL